MHLFCIAETRPDTYPKFKEWLERQSNGHGHPMVREVKILDITMKEQDKNYWAALLKKNVHFHQDYTRHGLPKSKLEGVVKWLLRLLPLKKHEIEIDEDLVDAMPVSFPVDFGDWMYLYPVGMLKDNYTKEGYEWL